MTQTKAVGKKKGTPSIFGIMAVKYNLNQEQFLQTIKNTIIRPGKNNRQATMEEIAAFLIVANKYGLDPFTKEIYAYPSKEGGIIPVVGIDGFVRKINNHPEFDGMEIDFADETETMDGAKECPVWCEVKLYRKGIERPVVVREFLDEVYRQTEYASPWKTHTKRMLRHKTIIQAGRAAGFLAGVYDEDEAQRIIEAETVDSPAMKPDVEMPQSLPDSPASAPSQEPTTTVEDRSTEAQQRAIHTLAKQVWKDKEELYLVMQQRFGVSSTKDLKKADASTLIDELGEASKALGGDQQ